MAIRISAAVRAACLDLIADAVDGGSGAGTLKVYSGSQPSGGPDASVGSSTLLATFTLNDPAFASAVTSPLVSVAMSLSTPLTTTASAAGSAGWARIAASDGTAVYDGSVGVSTANPDFVINSTSLLAGQAVKLTAVNLQFPV